jgi:hypothetical protein
MRVHAAVAASDRHACDRRPHRRASRRRNRRLVVPRRRRARRSERRDVGHARNVILFLGDGMSLPTSRPRASSEGQRNGHPGEENQLSFENLPEHRAQPHLQHRLPDAGFGGHDDRDRDGREDAPGRDRHRPRRDIAAIARKPTRIRC